MYEVRKVGGNKGEMTNVSLYTSFLSIEFSVYPMSYVPKEGYQLHKFSQLKSFFVPPSNIVGLNIHLTLVFLNGSLV